MRCCVCLFSPSTAGQAGGIGCYSNPGRGTWESARSECAGLGGHMVAVESQEENIALSGN